MSRWMLLIGLALLAGCYETSVPLGKPDEAKIDPRLIGDWNFPAVGDEKPFTLIVRNLDNHQYYAEWGNGKDTKDTTRTVAIVVPIKDQMFAQVRPLKDDATIEDKHWIMRVSLADGKLGIQQLQKDLAGHEAQTTEQLRKVLEENAGNSDLYDGPERFATKEAPTTSK